MADTELPQLYLVTPPDPEPMEFGAVLARLLDAAPVACVRIAATAGANADDLGRAADELREIAHARDVAIVIESHLGLAERHGLDGVHLGDAARSVRKARKALGSDAIVGAFCGASRHEGMTAGEAGADYVAFGPAGATGLGDGSRAGPDLFAWWSQMIEVPVVAEGGLTPDLVRALTPVTDFFALGAEMWHAPDPLAALNQLRAAMTG